MDRRKDIPAVAHALMDRRRYRHVLRLLDRVPIDDPEQCAAAHIARGRCLMEQARLRAAYRHFRATSDAPPTTAYRIKAELWCGFLALYGVADPPEPEPAARLQARINAALERRAAPEVHALALDLAARLSRFRIVTGEAPVAERPSAAMRFARAIDFYRAIGDLGQALRSMSRLAVLWSDPPTPDLDAARQWYQQVEAEADAAGCPVLGAEAALEIFAIDYGRYLAAAPADPEPAAWRERSAGLQRRLAALGVAHAEVMVDWTRARLMLRADVAQGVPIARRCAERLAGSSEERLRQEIWAALERWYNATGDRAAADAIRPHLQPTDPAEALPIAAAIARLADADRALRAGDYGEAERLAEAAAADAAALMVRTPALLILANVRNTTGRRAQALELLNPLVDALSSEGDTTFLHEALTVRIAARLRDDPAGALDDLERAMALGDAAERPIVHATQLALRAHLRAQLPPGVEGTQAQASALVDDFERAEALLAPHTGPTARVALANVLEYRALHAMRLRRHREAEAHFGRALGLARDVDPGSKLGFALLMHALALIAVGREGEADAYLRADAGCREAQEVFSGMALKGVLWRIHFLRAVCASERPQAAGESDADLRARWHEALAQLDRAAEFIEAERSSLRRWRDAEDIEAVSEFAFDKDAVYREAVRVSLDLLGDVGAALRWVERGRGWARLDAMADAMHPPPTLGEHPLIARDFAMRQALRDAQTPEDAVDLLRRIDANLDAMRECPETAAHAALRSARPPPWPLLMQALSIESGVAQSSLLLVLFYRAGPQWLLFGLRADWPEPRVRRLEVEAGALDDFAYWLAADRMLQSSGIDPQAEDWRAHSGLLAPLADWSSPGDRVCIVPFHIAHALPLHTLEVDGQPLIARNPVGLVSSLSEFLHLHHRAQSVRAAAAAQPMSATVFGNPTGDLRGAHREAEAIARMLGVRALVGAEVRRERLLSALETADLFAYCGHGRFVEKAGLQAHLQLGDEARVSAEDILALRRVPGTVLLSACRLAVHQRTAGDDLLGMSFALSARGARHLVAAQWSVNDAAAERMGVGFVAALLAGASPAESLRQAVLEVRQQARWAHVYHWGAFVLHGIP